MAYKIVINDRIWRIDPNEPRGIWGRYDYSGFWDQVKAFFSIKNEAWPRKYYVPGWIDLWGEKARHLEPYQWTMFDEFTSME